MATRYFGGLGRGIVGPPFAMGKGMSIARPVIKGASMMLTRSVRGREFLLRPSPRTNQIVRYVVAVMSERFNVQVHAVVAMSNHWHLCTTDPDGRVVEFQTLCHALIARAINAAHAEFENLWSCEQSSRVTCEEPADLLGKIAYTMANPVEAGLVAHGSSWPGVRHCWPRPPRAIARPCHFFRSQEEGGSWPDEAVLRFTRPPGFENLCDDALAELISRTINAREQAVRDKAATAGKRFLGRRAVKKQSRHQRPRTQRQHFRISPEIACRNKWRRIERLQANKEWLAAYVTALRAWRNGNRSIVFPYGTHKMRVVHQAQCAPPPH